MDAIETMDSSLMSAMVKSLETGSLTPMIKEELRLKIQTSRLAAGKEELPDVVFKEPEKHALTAEEERRREHRRERNRIAALKCRSKKKSAIENAEKELREQIMRKKKLDAALLKLQQEKDSILRDLRRRNIPYLDVTSPQPEDKKNCGVKIEKDNKTEANMTQNATYSPLLLPSAPTPQPQPTSSSPFQKYNTSLPPNHLIESLYSTSFTPPPPVFNYSYTPVTPSTSFESKPESTETSWTQLLSSSPQGSYFDFAIPKTVSDLESTEPNEQQMTSPNAMLTTQLYNFNDFHPLNIEDYYAHYGGVTSDKQSINTVKETHPMATDPMCSTSELVGMDEAQVPGYLLNDDEVISSQELLTLYD